MYISAYLLLVAAFICAIFFAGLGAMQVSMGRSGVLPYTEKAHIVLVVILTMALIFLVNAFVGFDFSLEYVFQHSNTRTELRYRLSALWAGQAGFVLLWAWLLALCGFVFRYLPVYRRLTGMEKLWFWIFFHATMALFLLLLTSWDNPFLLRSEAPPEGLGLSPLLRHPAMIFHQPLQLLGYSLQIISACLALSCLLCARRNLALDEGARSIKYRPIWPLIRPAMLLGWFFLTMGVLSGAWRAHWEMSFGGYWTWDPVECSSLPPWLIATACLHAGQAWHKYRVLPRYAAFLVVLAAGACLFSVWLVSGNIVSSAHSFEAKSSGIPFLVLLIFTCALGAYICITCGLKGRKIERPFSSQGRLFLLSWVFLAFAGCVSLATIWPLFSRALAGLGAILPDSAGSLFRHGAGTPAPGIFNSIALPFVALCGVMLLGCALRPMPSWSKVTMSSKGFWGGLFGIFFIFVCGSFFSDSFYVQGWGCVAIFTVAGVWWLAVAVVPRFKRSSEAGSIAVGLTHFALALLVVGVFASGLGKSEHEMTLSEGGAAEAGEFTVSLVSLTGAKHDDHIKGIASLLIEADGNEAGRLEPEARRYFMQGDIHSSTADGIFWQGGEIRAGITEIVDERAVRLSFSVMPFMSAVWIGGLLMAVFGLSCLGRTVGPGGAAGRARSGVHAEESDGASS